MWLLLDADLARGLHRGGRGRLARRRWANRLGWGVVAGAIGVGLTAFWLIPFATGQAYTTNMGWTNVDGFPHLLFPASARWVVAAAAVGVVAMIVRRNRVALFIAVMGGFSAAVICLDPQGKLYNVRFLPFWFLCLYLMAGYALAEVVAAVARWNRRRRLDQWVTVIRHRLTAAEGVPWRPGMRISRFRRPTPGDNPPGSVVGPLIALAAACLAVVPPLILPASTLSAVGVTVGANQPGAWAEWNYSGYEGKPDYPEYHAVIQMMARVGADQGCGRAMWEYDPSENRFGTTMALMLLPYWTNGCVDSMEGLLFESSATTPYHFINQNELSVSPSDAVNSNDFQYLGLNVPLGIRHLQLLGVRYFLAASTTVEAAAATDPNLTQVASSGPWTTSYNGQSLDTTWKVYEIKDSLIGHTAGQPPRGLDGGQAGPDQLVEAVGRLVRRSVGVERGPGRRGAGRLDQGAGHRHQAPVRCPSRPRWCRTSPRPTVRSPSTSTGWAHRSRSRCPTSRTGRPTGPTAPGGWPPT